MKRWILVACVSLVLSAGVFAPPPQAFALEQRSGDVVTVSDDVNDDLYVFGSSITVSGKIDGDVVAFGTSISITGDVTGDVIAAGSNINVTGSVGGTVRAAGSSIQVTGDVANDVVLAGGQIGLPGPGSVGRDAALAGGTVAVDGEVKRDVQAGAGTMSIGSLVGGNVTADVGQLTVASGAQVDGDLTYYSDTQARIDGTVSGKTVRHPARTTRTGREPTPVGRFLFGVLGWMRSLVGMALFALLALWLLGPFVPRAADSLIAKPLQSVGIGFLITAAVLPFAGIAFVAGLLVGGWWIAFVVLAVVWIAALVGVVVTSVAVGRWVLARMGGRTVHPVLAALFGLLLIWIVGAVPFLGWFVRYVAMLFGLGALALTIWGRPKVVAQEAVVPAAGQVAMPPQPPAAMPPEPPVT